MNIKNSYKEKLFRSIIGVFLILGLVFALQPTAKACGSNDIPGFSLLGGLFQSYFQECRAPLAATAVGSLLFIRDFDYSMPGDGVAESYSASGDSWAHASTETGQINLVTQGNFFFDWSAGLIVDRYFLGEGVEPSDVNVNIHYEGSLSSGGAFGIALFGSNGFEAFGKSVPGEYNDNWIVPLEDIAQVNDNEICMGFLAFTFALDGESSATFGEPIADFPHTFDLSFVDDYGNKVPVDYSEGGFSQVPIPGTLLLFAPGLIGIFAFRRKKS